MLNNGRGGVTIWLALAWLSMRPSVPQFRVFSKNINSLSECMPGRTSWSCSKLVLWTNNVFPTAVASYHAWVTSASLAAWRGVIIAGQGVGSTGPHGRGGGWSGVALIRLAACDRCAGHIHRCASRHGTCQRHNTCRRGSLKQNITTI